jgi:hypothetical protein
MPAIRDDASTVLTQRGVGLSAVGVLVVAAIGWKLLSGVQPTTALAGASPIRNLTPYTVPNDSPVTSGPSLPGQTMLLQRDPFTAAASYRTVTRAIPLVRPPVGSQAVAHRWQVTAVLITRSRRAAVIDDSLIDEGASVPGGARLTSVTPDRVIVTDARGTRHMLTARDSGETL